ncbi:MAG: tetratricopeptide repeat protein [Phycisphaerae bacterium]
MSTSRPVICRRTGRFALPRASGLVLLALMFTPGEGRAQYRIDQAGRLLDANPQLGGSRYNYPVRPISPLVGGNPFATGNVGRGFSLRSFSPISAANELRATLGSTSLSNFIRDSVSVADQYRPLGGLTPRAFFDPVRTAPTSGFLRGFYDSQPVYSMQVPGRPVTAAPAATTPFSGVLRYGSPPARRAEPDRPGQTPSEYLGAPLNTELFSTIFGVEQPRLPGPLSDVSLPPRPTYLPEVRGQEFGADGSPASAAGVQEPLDLRVWPEGPIRSVPTPLDILVQENAARLFGGRTPAALPQPGEMAGAPDTDLRPEETQATDRPPGEPTLPDVGSLLGKDVFTDLQLALDLSLNPEAEWYTEMLGAAPGSPALPTETPVPESPTRSVEMQARAAAAAQDFLTRILEAPLQTFAGRGVSARNDELRKAEAAMELGRYYDAVRHYERAHRLDPANPLALIGKGYALLAAGEYVSAALSLISGLERFPQFTHFRVDLTALLGGGEIVDIRRADLMKLLARNEDPQLRFLLGYLEIHTGQRELGLENLDRAAREAKPGTLIWRYPDLVRRKGAPPPKPAPDAEPNSTTDQSLLPGSESPVPGKESE